MDGVYVHARIGHNSAINKRLKFMRKYEILISARWRALLGVPDVGADVEIHPGGAAILVIGRYCRLRCTGVAQFLGGYATANTPRTKWHIAERRRVRYAVRKFTLVLRHSLVGVASKKVGNRVPLLPAGTPLYARPGTKVARKTFAHSWTRMTDCYATAGNATCIAFDCHLRRGTLAGAHFATSKNC